MVRHPGPGLGHAEGDLVINHRPHRLADGEGSGVEVAVLPSDTANRRVAEGRVGAARDPAIPARPTRSL